jgi:hypothetical protein
MIETTDPFNIGHFVLLNFPYKGFSEEKPFKIDSHLYQLLDANRGLVRPVPLTPDLLQQLGFTFRDDNPTVEKDGALFTFSKYEDDDGLYELSGTGIDKNGSKKAKFMNYLHELQGFYQNFLGRNLRLIFNQSMHATP